MRMFYEYAIKIKENYLTIPLEKKQTYFYFKIAKHAQQKSK